jgi:hypothetical protein
VLSHLAGVPGTFKALCDSAYDWTAMVAVQARAMHSTSISNAAGQDDIAIKLRAGGS